SFDVEVTTIGMSGCWSGAGMWARPVEGGFDLIPTDVHSGANYCTEIALYIGHHARITIDTPGEYTLRVKGRRLRQGDSQWKEPVSAQRTIVVQCGKRPRSSSTALRTLRSGTASCCATCIG